MYQEAKRLSMNSGFDLNKKREAAERAEGRKGLFVEYASISPAPFSQSDPPTLLSSYGLNCATFLSHPTFSPPPLPKRSLTSFAELQGVQLLDFNSQLTHKVVLTATGAIKSARPLALDSLSTLTRHQKDRKVKSGDSDAKKERVATQKRTIAVVFIPVCIRPISSRRERGDRAMMMTDKAFCN